MEDILKKDVDIIFDKLKVLEKDANGIQLVTMKVVNEFTARNKDKKMDEGDVAAVFSLEQIAGQIHKTKQMIKSVRETLKKVND